MSTTLSDIMDMLSQRCGDYLEDVVTTALTTNLTVTSTNLAKYTGISNAWARQWVYIQDYANAGAIKKIASSTTGALTCLGANFASDGANLATFQIHKYDPNDKIRAINRACRETSKDLFRYVRDTTLTTGNILPNPSFEDWTVLTTRPDLWTGLVNPTLAKSTTYHYGGSSKYSMSQGTSAGVVYINSTSWPRLMDLRGKTVKFRAWTRPTVAGDAQLGITYTSSAGVDTTTTSVIAEDGTTQVAGIPITLYLSVTLPDDMTYINVYVQGTTNNTFYWDNVQLLGAETSEYLLPAVFQNPVAKLRSVLLSDTDDLNQNIAIAKFNPVYDWTVRDDGTYKWLVLPNYGSGHFIQLEGIAPLESDSDALTDTISIDAPYTAALVEYAAYCLMDMYIGLPAMLDRAYFQGEAQRHFLTYRNIVRDGLRMPRPQATQLLLGL